MQERAKITKTKILETAIRLFSELGFYGTRVDAVAADAGVNKQRIYAYYINKAGLFEASLEQVFEEVSLFSTNTLEKALQEPENLTLCFLLILWDCMTNTPTSGECLLGQTLIKMSQLIH